VVDRYVDDAARSGMPFVRIIHGKGTGVLRAAVRAQLARHPLVKEFHEGGTRDGGDGVTVVTFA
jgi:DNA mismatch repair protein MutS2